jgi:RNA polymerase sigma-70 factor (ECF subfamily)
MTDGERSLWRAWEERRDGVAFERLVRPHLRFLSDFARRAGCGAEADDAVQAALVELAQARGDRPLRVPLRAWLGRSVLQQARMQRRARARRASHESAAARSERVDSKPSSHDEVERALARLDPDARLAVELRYLHDLDYKEIAHILKRSEIACRLRVHRAIARLRKELGILAPAMVAALPLLGGATEARAALARNAAAAAGTVLGGGLLMATKLKIAAVALLALAVLLLWRGEAPEAPPRSNQERRAAAETPRTAEEPAAAGASGKEGASGAAAVDEDAEPPLSPGNGCVRGLVRFEDGEPLRGARVSLWGESKVYAVTDERGQFHLHDDWVYGRAVYLAGPTGVRGDGSFGFILGPEVKMVEGETVTVEIVLKRGARVRPRVLSAATGEPVAGAKIELRRWDGDRMATDAQGAYGCTGTDATGAFGFDHVVPADYSLAISAKGFEAQFAHWDLRQRALPEIFHLENARRLEIRIKNAPPVAVGKEVRWCLQLSHFKDGQVVPRQEFFMLDSAAVMQEGGLLVTDAPPPGRYDLTVWRTDVLPQTERREIVLGSAPVETLTVEVAPGAPVEGTVRWPDGSPVEGAEVWAKGVCAKTAADGRYAFAWLPGAIAGAKAEFNVRLDGVVFPMGERTFEGMEPRVLDFALPGSGSVRFELKGAEAGKFVMIEIRRPGEDAPVLERRIDPPITEPILLQGVPSGPVRLDVWQWGRSWIQREIRVEDAGTLDLGTLVLPAWTRPEIRVRVPAGKNLPGFVLVRPSNDPGVSHGRSEQVILDGEGKGILPSQPPGIRRLLVQEPFGAAVEVEFTVDPERPQPVEVLLDPK